MTDKSITLTIREIFDLARAAQLIPHKATLAESQLSDEEPDTEYTIFEREGGVIVKDDDGTPRTYLHGAYLDEYPDEGTFPLGEAELRPATSPSDGARGASTEIQRVPESTGQSDTPETDAKAASLLGLMMIDYAVGMEAHARTLERQREQSRFLYSKAVSELQELILKRKQESLEFAEVFASRGGAIHELDKVMTLLSDYFTKTEPYVRSGIDAGHLDSKLEETMTEIYALLGH